MGQEPYVPPAEPAPPRAFIEQQLGICCWSKMQEILDAVASGERKILIRSCNGAGKTTIIAALCLWKLTQFGESVILTTASSWTQVRRNLWGEIRRQARAIEGIGALIHETSIRIDDKHYALGISPSIPENAMGFHAPRMLIAIDEATGVDRDIFDALSGNATSVDTQTVMICNPIDTHSYPYEAEHSGQWKVFTISAFEHPNVLSGREEIRGAVTREWIVDRLNAWSHPIEAPLDDAARKRAVYVPWLDKWYRRTPIVDSRILGEWADYESRGFIEADLVERSHDLASLPGMKAIGVDLSRFGNDDTVFAYFDGNTQLPFEVFHHESTMQIANRLLEKYREGWEIITIDDSGLGGGVSDRLRELAVPHYPVCFAGKPRRFLKHQKDLANARAELYFALEEELREGAVRLLNDELLTKELTAVRLDIQHTTQAYCLEDKDEIRRRLGRSPDRADSTALARYGLRIRAREKKTLFS